MYLLNEVNFQLRPKLLNELRVGTRIISHDFHMGTWRPDKMSVIDSGKFYQKDSLLYLYIVPAKVASKWRWRLNLKGEEQVFDLELNQTFQNITGTVYNEGQELLIFNPSLEGEQIQLSLVSKANDRMIQQVYNRRVQDNIIDGKVQLSGTIKNTILSWRATYVWQIPPNGFLTVE